MTDRDVDLLERVLDTTRRVVDGIEMRHLDLPTPCEGLDVRRLLEHVIGWQQVMGACLADREPPLADGSPTYRASADVVGDLRAASTTLLANLQNRTEEQVVLPYRGLTSVGVLHAEQLAEYVIHTWDLGAAVGVTVTFEDEVVGAAHTGLTLLLQESFAEMGFRSPATTVADSDELVRLLVRSGRSPGDWTAP